MGDKLPSLEESGTYLFFDGFTNSTCAKAVRFVLEHNLVPKSDRADELTFVINSPGGDVNAMFSLVDTIKGSSIPVRMIGLGQIASCGLMLFLAGDKGKRLITPNTAILSHQFSWGQSGKAHELFATVKEFNLTNERILNHYRKCTGLSDKKIAKHLLPAEDVWLSAQEAVDLGVADHIVTTY